ncbi:golgin subfamily A member 6C isoform X2 [Mastacembelus armatus]|uniref:golgin subfamily A member 6C isoform X2 n=1 Tax=Mastacembelus armatus TaxID=205130 RepID=UPI000E45CB43|nr:golgin subfamily A member 6C-like isoform X2 [Mastacembelus armatus]
MLRPPSPFSLTDLDMWDTKSCFTAQTSAQCGVASFSDKGFLSKVSTSTSGSEEDSGLRRWQSLSHLAPEGATLSCPIPLGAELEAGQGGTYFRQEVEQWLQNAHERLDTQLNRLRTRDAQLCYSLNNAELFDIKCKREAETRAKTQEEEQNQERQQLQTSTERTLRNQIEELNQRLSHTVQNHSDELCEANSKISQACLEKAMLSTQVLKLEDSIKELEAKLKRAQSHKEGLIQEKEALYQRVLKLHLERTKPGSESCELHDHLAKEESHSFKQDHETVVTQEELKALKEVNEKLTCELETIKQSLEMLQSQIQELTAERLISSKLTTHLEAKHSQLIREKEELLSKINEGGHEEKEKYCQLRESVKVLELEKQKLQDQCLCLEAKVLEKEEKLHLQEEEYRKQDTARVQNIKELKAVVSHWTEKWQKAALALQSTQQEIEELKKKSRNELQVETKHLTTEIEKLQKKAQKDKEQIDYLRQHKARIEKMLTENKKEADSLLRVELDACKQELELERSRSQVLLHRHKDKGREAVQTRDKDTMTDLSESSLLWEPPSDSDSSQNKSSQLMKKTFAVSQDDDVSTTDSLRAQLEESRRTANQLQQEKTSAVQRLQILKQLSLVKDEKPTVENRKSNIICSVNSETEQQRRMVTEQLKNLFKEREENEMGMAENPSAAGQTGASSPQDWTLTSKVMRSAGDRWNWQQSSGLSPVLEEDEEGSEFLREEEEPAQEAPTEENFQSHTHQMSAISTEISNLETKNEHLLQALRKKQPIQDFHSTTEEASKSFETEVPYLSECSDESDLPQTPYILCPDGIFLAELVDICSPDEDQEEGEDK